MTSHKTHVQYEYDTPTARCTCGWVARPGSKATAQYLARKHTTEQDTQ